MHAYSWAFWHVLLSTLIFSYVYSKVCFLLCFGQIYFDVSSLECLELTLFKSPCMTSRIHNHFSPMQTNGSTVVWFISAFMCQLVVVCPCIYHFLQESNKKKTLSTLIKTYQGATLTARLSSVPDVLCRLLLLCWWIHSTVGTQLLTVVSFCFTYPLLVSNVLHVEFISASLLIVFVTKIFSLSEFVITCKRLSLAQCFRRMSATYI